MRGRFCLYAVALTGLTVASSSNRASAAMFSWNFNVPSGSVASPHTYMDTTNQFALTAYGYKTTNTGPGAPTLGQTWGNGAGFNYNAGAISSLSLDGKTSSPDETGLGLDGLDSDHEIQANSFVTLDLQNLYTHGLVGLSLIIASIQSPEGFSVWGSNSLGTPGKLIYMGSNPTTGGDIQSFDVPQFGQYRYVSIAATAGDVLIGNGARASTPEPATLGVIFGGLAMFSRRRR
ncbi:MAG TPA: PEP-CTERM sorting domain-containing protein [Phycisphaerae bacterium]|nr:PEP-CTERM sorting domain-containing protein [Phycisphaerae bacterium]